MKLIKKEKHNVKNDFKKVFEQLKTKFESDDYLKSDFFQLNVFFKGIEKGHLITIGARPGLGREEFSFSLCNDFLKNNLKVLIFSTDITKENVMAFLMLQKAKVSPREFLNYENISEIYSFYEDKNLSIFYKPTFTTEEIDKKIKELKPDVVLISDIQALKTTGATFNVNETDLCVQVIKEIAIKNNVYMFLNSQLSRSAERRQNQIPMLSDLKNSSLLEELSNMIMFLHLLNQNHNDENADEYTLEVIIRKNAFGPTGSTFLTYTDRYFKNSVSLDKF